MMHLTGMLLRLSYRSEESIMRSRADTSSICWKKCAKQRSSSIRRSRFSSIRHLFRFLISQRWSQHNFRIVDGADIAILDVSNLWPMLQTFGKVAVEIDEERHREPRWAKAQMMAAAGYPERHKRNAIRDDGAERVFGTVPFVVLDKSGDIDRHNEVVVMKSTLERPHGWYFSGVSGGPMYVIQDELIIPVGIACAGWPQQPNEEPKGSLTDKDIEIHGQTLTPEFFGRWLIAPELAS